jgi:hypothetical protein
LAIQSAQIQPSLDEAKTAAMIKRWTDASKRYDSEPETGEGRKELASRAVAAQKLGEVANHKYHNLEISSGVLQVAIVLASSSIITNVMLLAWLAGGLGVVAVGFGIFAMTGAAALL